MSAPRRPKTKATPRSKTKGAKPKSRSFGELSYQVRSLADGVGEFIQYWGFRKIHGQVWLLVFLSAEPLSATEMKEFFGVSKALLSLAIHELLDYRLIEQSSSPDRKVKTYAANPNLMEVIGEILRNRELQMIDRVVRDERHLLSLCQKDSPIRRDRLEKICSMTEDANAALRIFSSLDQWAKLESCLEDMKRNPIALT